MLHYIPIVHAQADMGGLQDSVRRLKTSRVGRRAWERSAGLVAGHWEQVTQAIERLNLYYPQVRVYQDGLPVCGREAEMVADLAKSGSPNFRLLLELMSKGATIMGTESAELLIEEYQLARQSLAAGIKGRQKAPSLLEKRDQFIALRINETLQPGEVGILFIGALHAVAGRLASDIQVIYPIHRPAGRRSEAS